MTIRTALLAALVAFGFGGAAAAMCDGKTQHQAQAPVVLPNQDGASS